MKYKEVISSFLLCTTVTLGLLLSIRSTSAAKTLIVGNSSTCPGVTHSSIQAAVNAAAAGDTIMVCAGVFNETVTVNKTLILRGAQHGVDARTRSVAAANESVVRGSFNIQTDNVVIDGFKITGATGPGVKLSGVNFDDDVQVRNSIISDNTVGIYFNNRGPGVTVRFNLFDSNNRAGANTGIGIFGDTGTDHLLVGSNKFTGQTNAALYFNGGQVITDITNNQFVNDSSIILSRVSGPNIIRNTITGANSDAIKIVSGVDGARVSCNRIENSAGSALRLVGSFTSTNLHIKGNNIQGNLFGLKLDSHAYTTSGGRLDATDNWWGNTTGPDDVQGGNPGGTGDKLDDPDEVVDYLPFRASPGSDIHEEGLCEGETVKPPPPGPKSASFIYGIDSNGLLQWYRHDGAGNGLSFQVPGSWQGPRPVGRGWGDVKWVFPGSGNTIYAIT